jgi:hypothetical protein
LHRKRRHLDLENPYSGAHKEVKEQGHPGVLLLSSNVAFPDTGSPILQKGETVIGRCDRLFKDGAKSVEKKKQMKEQNELKVCA